MSKDNLIENKEKREVVYDIDQSYGAIVKRQFNKNRSAVWSLRLLVVIVLIGLSAHFLANDTPLYAKIDGKTYFPAFEELAVNFGGSWQEDLAKVIDWKTLDYESVIWAPIPYAQDEYDFANAHYKSPFGEQEVASARWRHWLGTDEAGRDVMSGMIHGTTIAVKVGVISMGIASIIGIIIGALAGFYGDDRMKASWLGVLLNLIFLPIAFFYASKFGWLGIVIFFLVMLVPNLISAVFNKFSVFSSRISIPLDILIMRFIEIFSSIPRLLLILTIVAISKPSIVLVMVIIGFTSWTGIARFTRGELLRVRNLEYMEAASSLGYSELRTIFRHALPNSLAPVLIAIAFGIAGAILTESMLSFLGIGTEAGVMTWGKLLSMSRSNFAAWWLAIIPGFAIFITVTIYNLMGEGLTDALDPKMKQ
ncbi:MAG: ABC transporter permease [Chitinophagales bacterium]